MSAQIAEGASDVGNAGIRIFVMREMSARGMRVQEMEIIILRGRTLHKCLNPIFGRHPWQVLTTQQGNAGRGLDAGRAIVRRNPGMKHRFAITAGGRGEDLERKSGGEGTRVQVWVDLGWLRVFNKKKRTQQRRR